MLPIESYKDKIVQSVQNNAFTIICAETGSGKSTKVPQYLAEVFSQVIVTEPRVMAAKTLARRVSEEMDTVVGSEVGYKTAYDKSYSEDSKILYCTDGLQLIKTIFTYSTYENNVLIIDEVHEWNLNIETLVAWCKFMYNKWNTKVVIMSATLEVVSLAKYFGRDINIVSVPGKLYEVKVEERRAYELIDTIKDCINARKNTLVFAAGKKEIWDIIDDLRGTNAIVLPLHGEMEWEDQKRCFMRYNRPKVVVATNVAQTSITIPDIDVVVDTGLVKLSIAENGIQGLFIREISQTDVIQRMGRAGRTKNGKYILCSETPIRYRERNTTPEIQRSILDRVVLQLAAIGLDAEKLEFFHQPPKEAIIEAKEELTTLGATDEENNVTELGMQMVKIPVSVQLARMIVEAQKYDVTEQVMTIAAIMEMGGLLSKEGRYNFFTSERESDLLAELDVWNQLQSMPHERFELYGVKPKTFNKIKEHLKKLKDVVKDSVEIKNSGSRDKILLACLSGLISHIYEYTFEDFYGDDRIRRRLDNSSCLNGDSMLYTRFVIGIPKSIEFTDKMGSRRSIHLISFASAIDDEKIKLLYPGKITCKQEEKYNAALDAVDVAIKHYFRGYVVSTDIHSEKNHPMYNKLKAEYEEEQVRIKEREEELRRMRSTYGRLRDDERRQESVTVDGKHFGVSYMWGEPVVTLDEITIYSTTAKRIVLQDGKTAKVKAYYSKEYTSIPELKNALENSRVLNIKKHTRMAYEAINVTDLKVVLTNMDKLGKVVLTMDDGGYGKNPIVVYGCITLKKNVVKFNFMDDEEEAKKDTTEALQFLFMKEISKEYSDRKFSHQTGKKRKNLTEDERAVKREFDLFVRDVALNLTVENARESLGLLDEYYKELMAS